MYLRIPTGKAVAKEGSYPGAYDVNCPTCGGVTKNTIDLSWTQCLHLFSPNLSSVEKVRALARCNKCHSRHFISAKTAEHATGYSLITFRERYSFAVACLIAVLAIALVAHYQG